MRSIIAGIAFAVAALGLGSVSANAAWTCEGPAYVCGAPKGYSAQKVKVAYNRAAKQRNASAYRPARQYAQAPVRANRNRVAVNSYRGSTRSAPSGNTGGGYSAGGGMASYYWEGQMTASGARFNPGGLTAAHRTLPFGTRVLVTNRSNGQSVVVTINDRGPFVGGRVIDLSLGAARAINMTGAGVAPVSIQVLGRG